jgi:hypothetical protein
MGTHSLTTNLLGRRVELLKPPDGLQSATGDIVTVYIDDRGIHYVVLVHGDLVEVEGSALKVLDDHDW